MAHQRQLSPTVFLDKMEINYRPMSTLVRTEQEKYFFRLKTAVSYGTVKHQAGAVFKIPGFLFRRFLI